MITVHQGDNLRVLAAIPSGAFDLIYIDPPFNTGRTQQRTRLRTHRDAAGDRTGFGGQRYSSTKLGSERFADTFDDYLAFLEPRLLEAKRVLRADGSLFVHLDAREVHYVKVLLDGMFGRASFMNEIIWAYDYGGRSKTKWAQKHDTILWYAKDPSRYTFRKWIKAEPVQFAGWKQFYKPRNDSPRTTIAEILRLHPKPLYIQYQ